MILYKYYPCNEYTFRSLSLPGLWCHYPSEMNDPFECLGYISPKYSGEYLENFKQKFSKSKSLKLKKLSGTTNSQLNEILTNIRKDWILKYTFCSLSEVHDDILMWSHYSNSHQRCVIGYEFDIDEIQDLHKVNYTDEVRGLDLDAFFEFLDSGSDELGELMSAISIKVSA